jgi:hypothetical protein
MKKKFKYRKTFKELAETMGLFDEAIMAGMVDPVSKEGYQILVNNQRRFVKGSLKLSLADQERNIKALKDVIIAQQQERQAKAEVDKQTTLNILESTKGE